MIEDFYVRFTSMKSKYYSYIATYFGLKKPDKRQYINADEISQNSNIQKLSRYSFTMSIKFFILAQLFVFSFAKTCDKPGQCVNSVFLGSISSTSSQECKQICDATIQCEFVSFDYQSNVCLLFEDCSEISEKYCPTCRTTSNDCIECNIVGACIVSI